MPLNNWHRFDLIVSYVHIWPPFLTSILDFATFTLSTCINTAWKIGFCQVFKFNNISTQYLNSFQMFFLRLTREYLFLFNLAIDVAWYFSMQNSWLLDLRFDCLLLYMLLIFLQISALLGRYSMFLLDYLSLIVFSR